MVTSGLRFGTAAVTTRGMGADEMVAIANAVDKTLSAPDDSATREKIRAEMAELGAAFPLYESF